ncbi:MAG TPA: hypothetical protein VLV45_04805 [Gemmatimonadales bacterium]|nr:hypothetical protein [Gemmatimonadales bacterium]
MRLTSRGIAVAVALAALVACEEGPGTIGISTTSGGSSSASRLVFTVQPAQTQVHNALIVPALQLSAVSSSGNVDTTFTAIVTLTIGTNPGGATLGGNTQIAAASGIATFNNLTISAAGNGYTLVASASGVSSATSAAFNAN